MSPLGACEVEWSVHHLHTCTPHIALPPGKNEMRALDWSLSHAIALRARLSAKPFKVCSPCCRYMHAGIFTYVCGCPLQWMCMRMSGGAAPAARLLLACAARPVWCGACARIQV